jgi:ABC-type transporter Mla subunit MlaD
MTTAAKKSTTAVDHLQHAVDELDSAREQATHDVRERIDAAIDRIRRAATDARDRAERERDEFGDTLERAGDDVRLELGRRAVRAQSSPEALKELGREVRHRQAELAG